MIERLTDEQLHEWASTKSPVLHNCATELLAMRARVAKLETALRKVRLLVSDDVLRDHGFLRDVGDALQ